MTNQTAKNWCENFFDDLFAEHHLVRGQEEIAPVVSFLQEKLQLKPGNVVFDQCCGVGGLAIGLARKGSRVVGVDLIPSYIERARWDAASAGVRCVFEVGDAHEYTTIAPCDAAVNWWTSFGYTPDSSQNIKMLQCVAKSLKKGGWFALDYMNAPQRLKEFHGGRESSLEMRKENCTILWKSWLDTDRGMIVKEWNYSDDRGRKVSKLGGGAKLYTRADLEKMFTLCGFQDISFYGDVAGHPLSDDSMRCIVVARKG